MYQIQPYQRMRRGRYAPPKIEIFSKNPKKFEDCYKDWSGFEPAIVRLPDRALDHSANLFVPSCGRKLAI